MALSADSRTSSSSNEFRSSDHVSPTSSPSSARSTGKMVWERRVHQRPPSTSCRLGFGSKALRRSTDVNNWAASSHGLKATFTAESQDSHELKDAPLRRSRGSSGGGPFGFGLSGGGAGGALRLATLTRHNKAAARLAAAGRLILPAVSYAYDRATPATWTQHGVSDTPEASIGLEGPDAPTVKTAPALDLAACSSSSMLIR